MQKHLQVHALVFDIFLCVCIFQFVYNFQVSIHFGDLVLNSVCPYLVYL